MWGHSPLETGRCPTLNIWIQPLNMELQLQEGASYVNVDLQPPGFTSYHNIISYYVIYISYSIISSPWTLDELAINPFGHRGGGPPCSITLQDHRSRFLALLSLGKGTQIIKHPPFVKVSFLGILIQIDYGVWHFDPTELWQIRKATLRLYSFHSSNMS